MNGTSQMSVSVVIPTRNRPLLVHRAVESALSQTMEPCEVLVVVDGPDNDTVEKLSQISDPRLKVIVLPESHGAAGARNLGVKNAKGEWIAFLDDDDKWNCQKLEYQFRAANHSRATFPVVYTCFTAITSYGNFVWPRRILETGEAISDYLFTRKSLFFLGETFMNTSTLFTSRELLLKVPFDTSLYRHEDWQWLLQVSLIEAVEIQILPKVLAESEIRPKGSGNKKTTQSGLSNINDWEYSLNWIRSVKHLVSPKAYAGFLVSQVSPQAASEKVWNQFFPMLWEAMQRGKLNLIDYLAYLSIWLFTQETRQKIRNIMLSTYGIG